MGNWCFRVKVLIGIIIAVECSGKTLAHLTINIMVTGNNEQPLLFQSSSIKQGIEKFS